NVSGLTMKGCICGSVSSADMSAVATTLPIGTRPSTSTKRSIQSCAASSLVRTGVGATSIRSGSSRHPEPTDSRKALGQPLPRDIGEIPVLDVRHGIAPAHLVRQDPPSQLVECRHHLGMF